MQVFRQLVGASSVARADVQLHASAAVCLCGKNKYEAVTRSATPAHLQLPADSGRPSRSLLLPVCPPSGEYQSSFQHP
jgi:hypothetical protein